MMQKEMLTLVYWNLLKTMISLCLLLAKLNHIDIILMCGQSIPEAIPDRCGLVKRSSGVFDSPELILQEVNINANSFLNQI